MSQGGGTDEHANQGKLRRDLYVHREVRQAAGPGVHVPRRRQRDVSVLCNPPDGQLFAVLFGTGLRKSEARNLRREHVDLSRTRLIVYQGKGGKDRMVPMTAGSLQAVADLDLFEQLGPKDHLWYSRPGGSDRLARRDPISTTTFSRWYDRCLERGGIRYLSPHTTRHTYADLMRRAGLALEERQLVLGHESIRTTADIYGHITIEDVAAKLALLEAAQA